MNRFTPRLLSRTALSFAAASVLATSAFAAPYASGVSKVGTTVSFTLNEPADLVRITFPGGGAPVTIDGSTKGTKTFTLPSANAAFKIYMRKNDTLGYTIPTGSQIPSATGGLSQATNGASTRLLSDDSALFRFNSPRGIDVSRNPNSPNFGLAYVSNSAAATTTGAITRTLGDGMYALKADGSDAFGYGDTAYSPVSQWTASTNSPFRVVVGGDGSVYTTGFGDAASNVWRMNANLTTVAQLFGGITGPTAVPDGQNHGSITAAYVEGNYGSNLTVYTLDEDLVADQFSGKTSTSTNNLWRYDLGTATDGYTGTPTKINNTSELLNPTTSDVDRGKDGKFYLSQGRAAGTELGVVVFSATGDKLWDSLSASRTLLNDPAAVDILRQSYAIAVSPDQKFFADLLNNGDVAIVPLVGGIPDLANRKLIDTGTDVNTPATGRDISIDAAGNIHYVSAAQGFYRILSPGGFEQSTLSFDGTNYAFTNGLPGDYNNDGFVDSADYTVWADHFGATGSNLLGDGNGDGIVDSADYTVWADNFGSGAPAGSVAIPEPAAFGAVLPAVALLARRRRA